MPEAEITIRECTSFDDFKQCIDLERSIWRDDDIDIMPTRLYMLSKTCNAPTIGAFERSGRLIGFVHTMLALVDDGHSAHGLSTKNLGYHSHMLAVVEDFRDKDVGHRIKLAQREFAIRAGVPLVFWTFDPLQSRNAHFNINKLGAIIRRYEVNYYGERVSTVFDPDVPSDRAIAEWWVSSSHAASVIEGKQPVVRDQKDSITIPEDISAVRAHSLEEHLSWRLRVREEFLNTLDNGAVVRGFTRDPDREEGRYLIGPDEEQFHFGSYIR